MTCLTVLISLVSISSGSGHVSFNHTRRHAHNNSSSSQQESEQPVLAMDTGTVFFNILFTGPG